MNNILSIIGAGTTSGAVYASTAVSLQEYVGPAIIHISHGVARGAGAVTQQLRVEFSGTAAGDVPSTDGWGCINAAGTLAASSIAAETQTYSFHMNSLGTNSYVRIHAAQGGTSPIYPIAACMVGTKIQN